jgi:LacI family transcriptional regulator
LHERRVDGIIFAPSATPELALDYLARRRLPCVLIDRMADPRFDQIGVDNLAAMQALVDHVVAMGHRHIGFVAGQPGFATTVERVAGFHAALAANGLRAGADAVVTGNASTACATAAAHRLLAQPQPPTVIVTGNNMATVGVMRAVRERGLAVPGDLSLVGIDDFEWADLFEPRLTLVAQPCAEIGRQAAALLVERITAPEGARRSVRLAPELHARTSCRSLA